MQTLNARTLNHLVDRLAPRIAERLAARPRPGDVAGDPEELLTEIVAAAILGLRPATLCTWRSPIAMLAPQTRRGNPTARLIL